MMTSWYLSTRSGRVLRDITIPDTVVILRDQAEESLTASATTYIMMAEIKVWGYVTKKEIKGQK